MDNALFDLLNSDWHDWHGTGGREERLDNPGWLRRFMDTWGLKVDLPYTPEARRAFGELRTLARRMVDDFRAGRPLAEADVRALNANLARGPVRRRLAVGGQGKADVELEPASRNWDWVLAETAGCLADLLAHGEPERVKICENEACGWVFYDESRNRSRVWCDSTSCGNLVKVRRFRARRKAGEQTGAAGRPGRTGKGRAR